MSRPGFKSAGTKIICGSVPVTYFSYAPCVHGVCKTITHFDQVFFTKMFFFFVGSDGSLLSKSNSGWGEL